MMFGAELLDSAQQIHFCIFWAILGATGTATTAGGAGAVGAVGGAGASAIPAATSAAPLGGSAPPVASPVPPTGSLSPVSTPPVTASPAAPLSTIASPTPPTSVATGPAAAPARVAPVPSTPFTSPTSVTPGTPLAAKSPGLVKRLNEFVTKLKKDFKQEIELFQNLRDLKEQFEGTQARASTTATSDKPEEPISDLPPSEIPRLAQSRILQPRDIGVAGLSSGAVPTFADEGALQLMDFVSQLRTQGRLF